MRFLLSLGGGLLTGIACGFLGGLLAALLLAKLPGGSRDGQGAMTGMFVVGPVIGFIVLIATSAILWRLSAVPERIGPIAMSLGGLLVIMVISFMVTMAPKGTPENEALKGFKGGVLVEVKFIGTAPRPESLVYQLRQARESLDRPAEARATRVEDGATIVPGEFPLRGLDGFIIFAIMEGERQRDVVSINLPAVPEPTEWSVWARMDQGSHMRWRVASEKK